MQTDRIIIAFRIQKTGSIGWSPIARLDNGRQSVFLIQDIFPITECYIERKYTVSGNHLRLTSEHTAREIEKKARRVVGLLKRGAKFMPTQPNIHAILDKLRSQQSDTADNL